MKKIFKVSILCLFITSLFVSVGCEKTKDYEDLLLAHIWYWDGMTTTSTNEDILNIVAFTNALFASATLQFHADGTYTLTLDDEEDSDVWELYNDNEMLKMGDDEMTLVKLTEEELVLDGEAFSSQYGTYDFTMSWKK
ncbi:MAG: hypothetical protein ACQERS_02295 [Bacteroidota bacterium]